MLHILLTILKIIGILILAILGLGILLVLLTIFTSLRYELNGDCQNNLDSLNIDAKLSFFFHLIVFRILYHDKELKWQAKLAWKHFSSDKSDVKKNSNNSVVVSETLKNKNEPKSKAVEIKRNTENKSSTKSSTKSKEPTNKGTSSQSEEPKQKKSTLTDKLDLVIEKIKCTSTKIRDMINFVDDKSELIINFTRNDQHKAALGKLLKEIKKLFKKLQPTKLQGVITFGFEDPGITGKVLAGISLVYPYIEDNLAIYPDFEEKKICLEDVYLKGRIRISMFLGFLLNLVLNKNVRATISHILKLVKELKQGGK